METLQNIIDCHFHLWSGDRQRFPFVPEPRYTPDYASTADQWDHDRVDAGIALGIAVSGAPYGDDPSFLYHSLELAPQTMRGICLLNPNTADSVERLEQTVTGRKIVGVRLQTSWLWGMDWDSPHLAAFWQRLGQLNLVAQMHLEPEWNPHFLQMVERFPQTRVVIDHLGRPRDGNAVDFMLFKAIAAHPHVYMKLSSFDSESGEDRPYLKVQPVVEELVTWFTTSRCVWGGNNYRGGMGSAAYRQLFMDAQRLLAFLSPQEQQQIFCDNPCVLFNLDIGVINVKYFSRIATIKMPGLRGLFG